MNNLYLLSAVFIAQVLVRPSKQLKQIIIKIEQNIVKNPNWPEANQLAIYNVKNDQTRRSEAVDDFYISQSLCCSVQTFLVSSRSSNRTFTSNHHAAILCFLSC